MAWHGMIVHAYYIDINLTPNTYFAWSLLIVTGHLCLQVSRVLMCMMATFGEVRFSC
jgi:hypothetical protein